MNTRKIGKIISVDSFRVVVELDDNLKSLYKSGFHDIYEIARINSYIIIPIGADRIVAIVTRVKIQDETEIERFQGAITLPKAKRYLIATMIGTIQGKGKDTSYIQGVYNYPVLDNQVWYVVKEDLDRIFDTKDEDSLIDFEKDYFLPIGTSPAFSGYKIKINPDKFFGKHAAILGNTGSGKSCTLSSIIQSLFKFQFKFKKDETGAIDTKQLSNAHFVIFDTNGEYKNAFGFDETNPYKEKSIVNSYYIDKEGMKIPYWFMNFDDFDYLFEPSAGTQAPLLKSILGLAKDLTVSGNNEQISSFYIRRINHFIDCCEANRLLDINRIVYEEINDYISYFENNVFSYDVTNIVNILKNVPVRNISKNGVFYNGTIAPSVLKSITDSLRDELNKMILMQTEQKISSEKNIDLPIWFDFEKMLIDTFNDAIEQSEESVARLREYASTLKLRMQSYFNDERISSPLLLKHKEKIENGLAKFLAFILGDFYKLFNNKDNDIFSLYHQFLLNKNYIDAESASQITIIDMSLLPYEVLETVTGLIGRLILDFSSRLDPRGSFPLVIVLEEAQNYIPEVNRKDRTSISKRVFERIAREGRKYGISLVVSSQRPSELSKTVLSQCNSFLIHRLQNPDDQKYVRQLVSAANEDILSQLPILPQQHAIIMGDAVRTPVQVRMTDAYPKPNSDNPKFIEKWLLDYEKNVPDYISIAKEWEGLDKEEIVSKNNDPDEDEDIPF